MRLQRPPHRLRRLLVLAAPAAVPLSMAMVFSSLHRRLSSRTAYNVGFAVYWLGWCAGFPAFVLGGGRAARILTLGRRPTSGELVPMVLPVLGAVATELLPRRRLVDWQVAAVMAVTAAVNAVGEELLWHALFIEEFPDDLVRGCLWPLAGFSLWHLAPQTILPARIGRWRFVLGAAVVGATAAQGSWRTGGVRASLLPHAAVDACGVTAARFRLGRQV
jgi:hypothetical protein